MMKKGRVKISIILSLLIILIGAFSFINFTKIGFLMEWNNTYTPQTTIKEIDDEFMSKLIEAAINRTEQNVRYDPAYLQIDYPMGDVPANTGVCTDVVIRSYRQLGIDLQEKVYEDMKDNFNEYPNLWRLTAPDTNIDHRRVPNLMVFFKRYGEVLPTTKILNDYFPGDLVTWDLGAGKTHIGIITNRISNNSNQPLIVHNIGAGPKLEDILFKWKITGHFRYYGK
jgi:hypothetical protein